MITPEAAGRLYALLFGTWIPKRASRMTGRSEQNRKYIDIPEYTFTRAQFDDHLAGRETYATTLGLVNHARAGCKDYDSASEADMLAALDIAAAKGISAAAFIHTDPAGGHTGGRLWVFYDAPYPEADIRAQLRKIPRTGKGEDYPSGNTIQLPFGFHKVKRSRGVLVFQDGRRFTLDTPAELGAGLAAYLALPLNGKPEATPAGEQEGDGGQAWGEAYKAEHWKDLPDGASLWRSARVAKAAEPAHRFALAALLRGERAVIQKKDDTIDDSDSAQVAALVLNLMHANLPESEIRAIARYLKPTIRPGKSLDHFESHVDAELVRYRPRNYDPQPTRYLGTPREAETTPLPPAEHRPERKSRARKDRPQKVAGPLGYLEWLSTQAGADSVVMRSQHECAIALGCCERTIKRYEKALGALIERAPYGGRQYGRLFLRGDNITREAAREAPYDVVTAGADLAQQHATNADVTPLHMDVHPAPVVTLREMVSDAFACYPGRANFAKVKRHVEMLADGRAVKVETVKRLYEEERKRRQWARQDAREAEKARALKWPALVKRSQALASQAAEMHRRGDKRAPVWEHRAGIYAAEEQRREVDGCAPSERLKRKRKPRGYTVAECEEWLTNEGRQRGACSPQTTPEAFPRPLTARERCELARRHTQTAASRAAVDRLLDKTAPDAAHLIAWLNSRIAQQDAP